MQFESEYEMKQVASQVLPNEFNTNACQVIQEFDYGPGRTDLVLVNVSDSYWNRRISHLNLNNPIKKKSHLQTFLQLQGRGTITEDYFYTIGAMKERQKRKSLEWLRKNGFIEQFGDKIRTTPELRRHVTTSIAVELKLRKWKDALRQAHRGRSFANYQYVVLDEDHARAARENLTEFKKRDVGLMSISTEGDVEKYYTPDRSRPYSQLKSWELNETTLANRVSG